MLGRKNSQGVNVTGDWTIIMICRLDIEYNEKYAKLQLSYLYCTKWRVYKNVLSCIGISFLLIHFTVNHWKSYWIVFA